MTEGTSTITTHEAQYNWLTSEFITWVRKVPLESDAAANIPVIIKAYEKRKTFREKLKQLFRA